MSERKVCKHCGESIRPNQTGGYFHPETAEHASGQGCFLFATPREGQSNDE